jgi:hypothetical protein
MNVYPVAPVATAAAVAAVTHQWEAQKQQDEAHATEVLREAVQQALNAGVRGRPLRSAHRVLQLCRQSSVTNVISILQQTMRKRVGSVIMRSNCIQWHLPMIAWWHNGSMGLVNGVGSTHQFMV